MRKIKMGMKSIGNYPIVERAPNQEELYHGRLWKKHKWLYKEKVNGKYRYFYTEAAHKAFLLSKKGKKAADALSDGLSDFVADRIVNQAKRSKLANALLGGRKKAKRDKLQAESDQATRNARAAERAMHEAKAKAASLKRQRKSYGWAYDEDGRNEVIRLSEEESALRKEAKRYAKTAKASHRKASSAQKRATKTDKAYQKTALGQAEKHQYDRQHADELARAREHAQDQVDAARAAAARKKAEADTSVEYQRRYIEERERQRERERRRKKG